MRIKPDALPLVESHLDFRVLGFAVSLSILTGLIFGLAPAMHGRASELNRALKEEMPAFVGSNRGSLLRSGLIIGQMAFSLTLLVGAGLCVRSFTHLQSVDPGYDCRKLTTVAVDLDNVPHASTSAQKIISQLLERLEFVPGVSSASFAMSGPLTPSSWMTGPAFAEIEGHEAANGSTERTRVQLVGPRYFETLGVPLLMEDAGVADSKLDRVIVNESFARRFWPGANPLGKRIGRWRVAAMVRDCRLEALSKPAEPEIFWERRELFGSNLQFLLRSETDPARILAGIREQLHGFHPGLSVKSVVPLTEMVERSTSSERFSLMLMGITAIAALLLSMVGIYGTMAFAVTRRSREIGVRMALGANAKQVVLMVMKQGISLVLIGSALGLFLSWLCSRTLSGLLYEISPTDPLTFVLAPILLLSVAILACWLPSLKAATVDPSVALRMD